MTKGTTVEKNALNESEWTMAKGIITVPNAFR